jgi:four helix bundle protein
MELAERTYRMTWGFPRTEQYGMSGQMQRAVVSIPSNIAKGNAWAHRREYIQLLSIVRASTAVLKTQIVLARRVDYFDDDRASELLSLADLVSRQPTALIKALETTKSPMT